MTEDSSSKQQPFIDDLRNSLGIFYQKIIAIWCLRTKHKVFLLMANPFDELFIEILDLRSNCRNVIAIKDKIHLTGSYLERNLADYQTISSSEEILWIDEVLAFFVPETMDYVFMKLRRSYPNHKENNTLNIQIDLEGNTLRKEYVTEPEGSFRNYDRLNGLVVIPDYNFFNTETFLKIDLYNFFDEYLDDEDFSYIRYTEDRCSSFATPAKNLYAIVIFDKDGEEPRGTFCVFEINGDINPKLIFKAKADEWGSKHVFSEDGKKIAYVARLWEKDGIEIDIRTLTAEDFNNEIKFTIQLSIDHRNVEKIFLTNHNDIILVFPKSFEIYNAFETKRKIHLKRDQRTTYDFSNNILFYLHKRRLKIYKT